MQKLNNSSRISRGVGGGLISIRKSFDVVVEMFGLGLGKVFFFFFVVKE